MKNKLKLALCLASMLFAFHLNSEITLAAAIKTCTFDVDCNAGQICCMGTCQGSGGGCGGGVPEFPAGGLYTIMAGVSGGLFWIRRFFRR